MRELDYRVAKYVNNLSTDYSIPKEKLDELVNLAIAHYLESLNQIAMLSSNSLIDTLMEDYDKYVDDADY